VHNLQHGTMQGFSNCVVLWPPKLIHTFMQPACLILPVQFCTTNLSPPPNTQAHIHNPASQLKVQFWKLLRVRIRQDAVTRNLNSIIFSTVSCILPVYTVCEKICEIFCQLQLQFAKACFKILLTSQNYAWTQLHFKLFLRTLSDPIKV
jgi:hypothetical protein